MREHAKLDFARGLRRDATDAERHLWRHLRRRQLDGLRFRRQHPIGAYIVDFACIECRLVVELDGSQHLDSRHDIERDRRIGEHSFRILRFWNHDVLLRTADVLAEILRAARPLPASGHPRPARRPCSIPPCGGRD